MLLQSSRTDEEILFDQYIVVNVNASSSESLELRYFTNYINIGKTYKKITSRCINHLYLQIEFWPNKIELHAFVWGTVSKKAVTTKWRFLPENNYAVRILLSNGISLIYFTLVTTTELFFVRHGQ